MTRRCLSWLIAVMLFCGASAYAKELCEFPYLYPGGTGAHYGTGVHYDFRTDAADVPFPSGPGGYKLYLWLNVFDDDGNPVLDSVEYVEFTNYERHTRFILGPNAPFVLDSPILQLIDFAVWVGHKHNLIGTWEVVLRTKDDHYKTTFTVDESMFELPKPVPVSDVTITDDQAGDNLTVSFYPPIFPIGNGEYRCRVMDESGSIVYQVRGRNMIYDPSDGRYHFTIPNIYRDYLARIETRFYGQPYPDACNTLGGTPTARAIFNFLVAP